MALDEENITFYDMGIMPYRKALELQEHFHQNCLETKSHAVMIVQHTPVVTVGHNAGTEDFIVSAEDLKKQNIDVVEIERGGKLTAHMPGQIVIYPIVYLPALGLMTKAYVTILEQTLIDTLQEFGITASVDPEYPGVWIGNAKIAAIGIRIKDRTTMHGLALNVNNDLSLFRSIVPCGIQQRSVTTMEKTLQSPVDISEVQHRLLANLRRHLGMKE